MKVKQLREKTQDELEQKLYSLKEQLYNLRYQAKAARLEKPSQIRDIKREVARIYTIIQERKDEATQQKKN